MNTLYSLLNNAIALFFFVEIPRTAGVVGIALISVIIIARLMGLIVGVILVCVMIALLRGVGFIGNVAHGLAPSLEKVGIGRPDSDTMPLSAPKIVSRNVIVKEVVKYSPTTPRVDKVEPQPNFHLDCERAHDYMLRHKAEKLLWKVKRSGV